MELQISESMVSRYPALRIAFLVARGIQNAPVGPALDAELTAAEAEARALFPNNEALEQDSRISGWREVYRSFNVNPKKFRPSAEALLRRVVKGDPLPRINTATNAYLLPQLTNPLPVGGYDLSRISGDIVLRTSPGAESFLGIGAQTPELTDAEEVVYADSARVLTRRWNFRDCDFAKITDESKDIALFVEGPLPQFETAALTGLVDRIAELLVRHCGGSVSTGLLDASRERSLKLG